MAWLLGNPAAMHVWNTALGYVVVRWVVFKGWYLFLRHRMASGATPSRTPGS